MFKINLNDSMLYFGLYVQLRRGSVAGYTTDESWAYGPKEGVEAFESITFFIRFIYAINFEHLLSGIIYILSLLSFMLIVYFGSIFVDLLRIRVWTVVEQLIKHKLVKFKIG